MTSSVSTFAALFWHALMVLGEEAPPGKRDAINQLASLLEFDPAPFHTILGIREGHTRGGEVDALATFSGSHFESDRGDGSEIGAFSAHGVETRPNCGPESRVVKIGRILRLHLMEGGRGNSDEGGTDAARGCPSE